MGLSLCSQSLANTGGIACDPSRGVLERIMVYNDAVTSGSYVDSATFEAYLTAAAKLSKDNTGKLFPFPSVQEIADASEADTTGTLGLGFSTVLRAGLPSYTLKVFAGMVQLKQLRKFNGKTIRIFEHDANGNLWGTQSGTTFKGFSAKINVTGGKIATGTNVEEGIVTITVSILSNSEYIDNAKYMPIEGNINDIVGLIDVNLTAISHITNVWKIGINTPTTQIGNVINIYDEFADGLAVGALWKAYTGTNYATPLVITSVVKDTALKAWTVTFDSTAYTALSSGAKIKLYLDAPETLAAADVTEIESDYVILTK